eukprot:3447981-Karenia_brevis.AAC.1
MPVPECRPISGLPGRISTTPKPISKLSLCPQQASEYNRTTSELLLGEWKSLGLTEFSTKRKKLQSCNECWEHCAIGPQVGRYNQAKTTPYSAVV